MYSETWLIVIVMVVLMATILGITWVENSADVKVDMGGFGGQENIHNVVRIERQTEGFKITCEDGKVHFTGNGRVEIRKKGLVVE